MVQSYQSYQNYHHTTIPHHTNSLGTTTTYELYLKKTFVYYQKHGFHAGSARLNSLF